MNKIHLNKQSKRYILILIVPILICLTVLQTSAHQGRTDGKGGHTNSATGDYHYHHGYPAHNHPGGICPYEYDDKTNHNSGSNTNSSNSSAVGDSNSANLSNKNNAVYIEEVASWILTISSIIALITYFLGKWLNDTSDGKTQAKIANFIFYLAIIAIIISVGIFAFT